MYMHKNNAKRLATFNCVNAHDNNIFWDNDSGNKLVFYN